MADLVNLLKHMAGKSVLVNGAVYKIDQDGVVSDVLEADAAKLLQSKAWMEYDPEAAAKREERRKALREEYKQQAGGIQLLTRDGQLVDPHAINEAQEKVKAKAEGVDYPSMRPRKKKDAPHSPEVDAGVPLEGPTLPEVGDAVHEEQATAAGADEWPDPTMEMTKSYLQDMANAYGLSFKPQTTKQELVTLIMTAMYDET